MVGFDLTGGHIMSRHVDGAALAQALDAPPATDRQTPKAFLHTLQRRCAACPCAAGGSHSSAPLAR
jgi:hypothetical protein